MKNEKIYVCHASECLYNNEQGGCLHESDVVTIAVYDGQAICPNFIPVDK